MKKQKKVLAILLTVAMVISLMPGAGAINVYANEGGTTTPLYSGQFGEGFSWALYSDGKLTISGSGPMVWEGDAPWRVYHKLDIKSVEIGEGITSIGDRAFLDCENLTSINIPASVTTIEDGAFMRCVSLETVLFETDSQLITIKDNAFRGCKKLTNIDIPANVTTIGDDAFIDCTNLTRINVLEGNQDYCSEHGVLFDKKKETLITYPAGKSDNSYIITKSVTSIKNSAFKYGEKLQSITIPNSVISIGSYAFANCQNLNIFVHKDCKAEFSTSRTQIKYTIDNDGLKITSIDLKDNQPPVAIPETVGGLSVAAVAEEYRSMVGEHTHIWDGDDPCPICGKVRIDQVSIVITEPKAGKALASKAKVTTPGVAANTVTWDPSDTDAGYNTAYTAEVTLSANTGYAFADSVAVEVNNLDVNSGNITKNEDGKITVKYKFSNTEKRTPTAKDFIFTFPSDLVYDGRAKAVTVTNKPDGVGVFTVNYFDERGKSLDSAPINSGKYIVKLDVEEGDEYKAINNLTAAEWKFTISPRVIKAVDLEFVDTTITKVYDGTTDSDAKVRIKAGVVGTEAVEISGTSVYDSADVNTAAKVTFKPTDITSGNYTLAANETIEHEAIITKKTVTGINQTLVVKENQAKDITYDLSNLLPAGVTGATTYKVGEFFIKDGVLSSKPTDKDITDGTLTLHVASVDSADKESMVTFIL